MLSADTTGYFDFNHGASAVGADTFGGGANPLARDDGPGGSGGPDNAHQTQSQNTSGAGGGAGGGVGAGSGPGSGSALRDGFDPFSVASLHLEALCAAAMRYEARAAEVALRRSLALSQALTLACSSFATKIQLLSRNRGAAVRTAISQWLDFGYLVYFEGLISTQVLVTTPPNVSQPFPTSPGLCEPLPTPLSNSSDTPRPLATLLNPLRRVPSWVCSRTPRSPWTCLAIGPLR